MPLQTLSWISPKAAKEWMVNITRHEDLSRWQKVWWNSDGKLQKGFFAPEGKMTFASEEKVIWEIVNWEKPDESTRLSKNTLGCIIYGIRIKQREAKQ